MVQGFDCRHSTPVKPVASQVWALTATPKTSGNIATHNLSRGIASFRFQRPDSYPLHRATSANIDTLNSNLEPLA
jgi:hypothetical protein